jgi:parvulin-like peptidyl-prolyl isomerase
MAVVNGEPISREEVVEPLVEANGLNFLLLTVQLKVAKQEAAKQGILLKPEDVEAERNLTIKGLFPDAEPKDYQALVDQLLQKQGISRPQFDLILQTNAILRKVAEPQCAGKVTEDNIKQAFDLKYGATVQIRDIKLDNPGAAQDARLRLKAGEPFESVAQRMSTDAQTRSNGGLWPPFAAATPDVSELIKNEAFGLKEGEVSPDVIATEGAYHIIKVVKRNPPSEKVVHLDKETHDYLLRELNEKYLQQAIKVLRARIAQEVMQPGVLDIRDPVLKQQFDHQLAEAKRLEAERQKSNMADMLNRLRPASQPTKAGATTLPATPGTEARDRPPATKSGE